MNNLKEQLKAMLTGASFLVKEDESISLCEGMPLNLKKINDFKMVLKAVGISFTDHIFATVSTVEGSDLEKIKQAAEMARST